MVKERKYKLFSFHVDRETMRMLKVLAAKDETTMADIIRGSIKQSYDGVIKNDSKTESA